MHDCSTDALDILELLDDQLPLVYVYCHNCGFEHLYTRESLPLWAKEEYQRMVFVTEELVGAS